MKKLNEFWLTEKLIDFEYKKYVLLAYLQEVKKTFNQFHLYPELAELVQHHERLIELSQKSNSLNNLQPKVLKGIDLKGLELIYEKAISNDALMSEIQQIIQYAIPQIKAVMNIGFEKFEEVEARLNFDIIGILPMYRQEGYLMLHVLHPRVTHVYEYKLSIFEKAKQRYRSLHLQWLESIKGSLINTFESIKLQMINNRKHLPVPASFLIECEGNYPLETTLLPIAKRFFIRKLSTL